MASLKLTGSAAVSWQDVPGNVEAGRVFIGQDDAGAGAIQVGVAQVSTRPNKALLEGLWRSRGTRAPMGFIVAAVAPEGVWIHYPSSDALPFGPITIGQAERQLQSVLDESNGLAAHARMRGLQDAMAVGGTEGFNNQFLFATYYLKEDVPRRADWERAGQRAAPALATRGADLVRALGFDAEPAGSAGSDRVLVLRTASGPRRAIAVLLRDEEQFDQRAATYQLTPVAKALEVAGREGVPWVIALRKSTVRLYAGQDGVGVGQRGQSETYFEIDLDLLPPEQAALLGLIFSAEALDTGGSVQQILEGSGKYAADLGSRLRDRVYEGVVPRVAIAIADRLPSLGLALDAHGLRTAYRLTMRILFRLLFQAYGEATGLLPAGRNANYDHNSLQTFVDGAINTEADEFSAESPAIWDDLQQVWGVIFTGNGLWNVPPYGGSLFDPSSEEGALLKRLELPDSVLGPALQNLLSEMTQDKVKGQVDFRSLQVREFGTIYEGLLESSLSLAEQDLTVDKNNAYVPAKVGDEIKAHAGHPYFHSASGERKATGSYYTPKIVVDHLIERSVEPALKAHLDRIKSLVDEGKERQAADAFFDFRVADLAMGSAHFLVAAVDKIERGMRDFLTATDVPGVRAELARLAEKAREALGQDADGSKAITDGQLLRRQVARRCIYGLDINPLAVELSQLALWIHTFVPGLPMSSLDHGLVLANSLTGIGTIDEAMEALNVGPVLEPLIREPLLAAKDLLIDYAKASEADRQQVAEGAAMLAKARYAAAPAKAIFDVAVARRLGVTIDEAWDAEQFAALSAMREVREAVDPLQPAHMPFLFPEVFLRERPGFDVLVGNPPWEVVKVEEQKWWGLRYPRLRALPKGAMNAQLARFRATRPDLEAQFRKEIQATNAYRDAIVKGPFTGLGSGGDPDMYQAFGWRAWRLLRNGGRAAQVLPRMALTASNLRLWRKEVLSRGSFADVTTLSNSGKWVFSEVHAQYSIALVVVEKGVSRTVAMAGPFYSAREFAEKRGRLSVVPAAEFAMWSAGASFPVLPDPLSVGVFATMNASPPIRAAHRGWEVRPTTELHATADKALYEFDLDDARGRVPVLKGASFTLWDPDFGGPFAFADPSELRVRLSAKIGRAVRSAKSPYFGLGYGSEHLPMDEARIAFRLVTNRTNSRTMVCVLLPPGVTAQHSTQFIVRRAGTRRAEAFLLGVLGSVPFDWASRRWVEINFTFEVLNDLPVPDFDENDVWCARVADVAGRLAAVDERYAEWAAEVSIEVGTVKDQPTKMELIAELDAVVSLLYGLTREQVEHVFATFHRGWNYAARLERVLAYYEQWKEAA